MVFVCVCACVRVILAAGIQGSGLGEGGYISYNLVCRLSLNYPFLDAYFSSK